MEAGRRGVTPASVRDWRVSVSWGDGSVSIGKGSREEEIRTAWASLYNLHFPSVGSGGGWRLMRSSGMEGRRVMESGSGVECAVA